MNDNEVRIVRLDPLHVAASYGFGSSPEAIAWEKLNAFVVKRQLGNDGQEHRFFGFNNPSPSPGSPNYGYEQWITVSHEVEPDGDIQVKDFQGGMYAVTRARLVNIFDTWQQLAAWREKSHYHSGSHQWLEEAINLTPGQPIDEQQMELDLYLPIKA